MSEARCPSVGKAVEFLDLEHVDGDLYRGLPGIWPADDSGTRGVTFTQEALLRAADTAVSRVP